MTRPADAAHEVYSPVADRVPTTVAEDQEADTFILLPNGVAAKARNTTLQPENETDADFGALEETIDDADATVYTGSIEIPKQPTGEEEPDSERKLGKAALATDMTTQIAAGNAETDAEAELDLSPDEDEDFEHPTLDGKPVPTDLVDAYRQSMTGIILEHEEIIERAKAVEAGKLAGWVLRVNDVVDSPDDDALLTFRQEYIENRQDTMRLDKKASAEGADTTTAEPEEQLSIDGKPLSKAKQAELVAARNREIKHGRATDEADELIALSLRYRVEAKPGETELPDELRADLAEIADQGTRARHDMIDSISRWTFKQSMRYVNKATRAGLKPIDVIQEGNIGAIRAVDKFDWQLGYKLTTYSDLWIKQSIDKAIAAGFEIRKPQHVAEKLSKIYRKEQELRASLEPDEELTEEMVADAMDMAPEELADYRKWDQQSVSLDKRIGDGNEDNASLGENFQDEDIDPFEDQIAELDRQLRLQTALEVAFSAVVKHPKQEFVLRARFGLDDPDGGIRTRSDIAKELKCSTQWVKIMEDNALKKIRGHQDIMQLLAGLR